MGRIKPKIPALIGMLLSLISFTLSIYAVLSAGYAPWVFGIFASTLSLLFYLIDAAILIYHVITTGYKGVHIPLIILIIGSIVVFSIFGQRGDTISTLIWLLYCILLFILEIFSIRAIVKHHD